MSPPCPAPRLCLLVKRQDFDGYGFNLHAERGMPGQFVGLIDQGSPAEVSGLRQGDHIVEVNGVNVTKENHKHVVERIKGDPSAITLLVSDKECDAYHREHGLEVTSFLPYVIHLSSNTDMMYAESDGCHPSQGKSVSEVKVTISSPLICHGWLCPPVVSLHRPVHNTHGV